ncbi:magnesium transporter MgtE N-terminal domain-containing protein [Piscibacillus salipiscarius]|nr:hypothetical protein [Piscibacillus salipiscarius]
MKNLETKQVDQGEEIKKLTNSFVEMEASNAADIIVQMNEGNAVRILSQLPDEARGTIMSEMNPENAASFTNLLMNQ